MIQKAAWPGRRPLTSLLFVLCACTSTTAESAGDAARMMRKEDPSNSAPEPFAVASTASVRGVHQHTQEQAGSELDQKKDLSSSASRDHSRTRNGTEASKKHVSRFENVVIMPPTGHKDVIKDITIPGKVIGVHSDTSTAAPQIVPYDGQVFDDPDPPDSQPDTNTPRPTVMKTADRLRQERSAAEKAGGKVGGNLPQLVKSMVPPKPRVISHAGFSSQIHRSDEGFQGMAQAAKELILEEELEKAEKQHHAALAAGIIDPPHAAEPEEDGDKYDKNDDDDEEDRRRFYGGHLSTAPPTLQQKHKASTKVPAHGL